MSVYPSELWFAGSANMPEADGSTVGGAVDFSKKPIFYDLNNTGVLNYYSSSASDTATKISMIGRDGAGVIHTENETFNGVTKVVGTQSFQRLLYAATSNAVTGGPIANPGGTTAIGDLCAIQGVRTVSGHTMQSGSANHTGTTPPIAQLQAGDGSTAAIGMVLLLTSGTGSGQIRWLTAVSGYGTDFVAVNRDWGTVPDNTTKYDFAPGMVFDLSPNQVTAVIRPFATVAADVVGGSTRIYYEKWFAANSDTATTLTSAAIVKQTDPAGLYSASSIELDFGLCTALNDTNTATNRQTAPTAGTGAYSSGAAPQSTNVPSPQNLPSGTAPNAAGAQGIWWRLTIAPGTAPNNTSFTPRITGQTT